MSRPVFDLRYARTLRMKTSLDMTFNQLNNGWPFLEILRAGRDRDILPTDRTQQDGLSSDVSPRLANSPTTRPATLLTKSASSCTQWFRGWRQWFRRHITGRHYYNCAEPCKLTWNPSYYSGGYWPIQPSSTPSNAEDEDSDSEDIVWGRTDTALSHVS
jgi:hypothetical protein